MTCHKPPSLSGAATLAAGRFMHYCVRDVGNMWIASARPGPW